MSILKTELDSTDIVGGLHFFSMRKMELNLEWQSESVVS